MITADVCQSSTLNNHFLASFAGTGHITGSFLTHRSLSGCPRAAPNSNLIKQKPPMNKLDDLTNTINVNRGVLTQPNIPHLMSGPMNFYGEAHEEIRALDEEIMELQEYNAKVESEMVKLKNDITQMEQQVKNNERVRH